jgi:hypothetical protein
MSKFLKFLVFVAIATVLLDQAMRFIVGMQIRNDRAFFEQALAESDFSTNSEDGRHVGCRYQRAKFGYLIKTCLQSNGWTLKQNDEHQEQIHAFRYWPPRSHLASTFSHWWYYEMVASQETVMHVTQKKVIIEEFF